MEKLDVQFPSHFIEDGESVPSPSTTTTNDAATAPAAFPVVTLDTEAGPRVYAKNGMKAWWASLNLRSHDGLPGLRSAHLSDLPLETGVEVQGLPEPPSDGSVVILGNRIPKASLGARLWHAARETVQLPETRAETTRLVIVFVLGLLFATVYGQGVKGLRVHAVPAAV